MHQRVSASNSPSCSETTSSSTALICRSASRTGMLDPSDSITSEYFEYTAIPGPMAACARSTGATLPCCRARNASGNVARSSAEKLRRSIGGASSGRGRSARTIEDARALVPLAIMRLLSSERTGHVAVIDQPARIMLPRIVSQPVEAWPLASTSDCLNA
ncbi:hypothetical protein [Leucobacter soli]|uniref:hypothetical protein n=1 Tax=Leucobacter soli TaxID=2812850 RepID=UPI003618F09C